MALLEVRGLAKSFWGVQAVAHVDLDVAAGTITALIGPNGAGKTTAFNCISGTIPPDSGSVVFDGQPITGARPDRITAAGLVRTFQIARGFPRLSVLENLMLYGPAQPGESLWRAVVGHPSVRLREAALKDRAIEVARTLNLLRVANNPASALSGGQKKLLEIGRALMAEPRMIMLDEPIAGVNPALAVEIGDHLLRLKEAGMTMLIIEHHMDAVLRLCDPVIVMAEGRNLAHGSFREVAENPDVQAAYMGRRKHG
jgi:ABC-type branched-subunit amino acid transport system ATPase component